jgi:serine protease Do
MKPLITAILFALAMPQANAATPLKPSAGSYSPMQSLAPLVDAVEPAVIAIEVEGVARGQDTSQMPPELRRFFGVDPRSQPRLVQGEGSGFVISEDGLVLTNYHVVANAKRIRARFSNDEVIDMKLLGKDEAIDVALLQLPKNRKWPHVAIADNNSVAVGDWVVAMGNSLGMGHTVTAGIISGQGRALGHDAYDNFIQTDAAINQGNSGGPLFNLNGEVIGINTAIIQGANTVGFAIPMSMVESQIEDLKNDGQINRGYLGIEPRALTDDLANVLRAAGVEGVLIARVLSEAPAANAGIEPGDIVTAIDGNPMKTPANSSAMSAS